MHCQTIYTEQRKETSHAFLHAFQQKYALFRYRQVCLLCDKYQAPRCTNSFLISTNRRRVSPIRLNARNHIENAKCARASLFLLGHLQDITTNQIHFEHEQILKTVSRKKKIKLSSTQKLSPLQLKYSDLLHSCRGHIF